LSWISGGFEGASDLFTFLLNLNIEKVMCFLHHKIVLDGFSSDLTLEGLRVFTLLRMRK
jgi:hypothetical protein